MKKLMVLLILGWIAAGAGCNAAQQPPYAETIVLKGTAYERGVAIGKRWPSKIRSIYTSLLTSSILPYLNREQPDVGSVLKEYCTIPNDTINCPTYSKYANGQFSYQLMLQSAKSLQKFIPSEYIEEMRGIADGAKLEEIKVSDTMTVSGFEQVLILNTFLDTMLNFRAMTFFIRQMQSPYIDTVQFTGAGDPLGYEPLPYATAVEVPADSKVVLVLYDRALSAADSGEVDPATVNIQMNDRQYMAGDPSIVPAGKEIGGRKALEITFSPPGGFPAASVVSLIIQAGDKTMIDDPPPVHARFMRDERITFTTKGYGKQAWEVENRGYPDGRTQPPSIGFAVRGNSSAVNGGEPMAAHHFALLDSNTSHKHTVLYVEIPDNGKPHMYLGWTGVVWGFSGMNSDGLVYEVNSSDTLNNYMVKNITDNIFSLDKAKLLAKGVPVGIMGREILSKGATTTEGLAYIEKTPRSYGWNILLADAASDIAVAETDSNIQEDDEGGFYPFRPDPEVSESVDQHGRFWSSIGQNDIRISCQSRKNVDDINLKLDKYEILPQRYWTSFYFRSLRTFYNLGDLISARLGAGIGVQDAIDIISNPLLVDNRDSMNAAIYLPAQRKLWYAMGTVPATDSPFVEFDLAAAIAKGVAP